MNRPVRAGYDCFNDAVEGLLVNHGADPRLLGDHWDYFYVESDAEYDQPFFRFRTSARTNAEAVRLWFGLAENRISHASPSDMWSYVSEIQAQGRVVALQLDSFEYPHTLVYRRQHDVHRVVISDIEGGRVFVEDRYPASPFSGWMQKSDLSRAVESDYLDTEFSALGGSCCTFDLERLDPQPTTTAEIMRTRLLDSALRHDAAVARNGQPTGRRAAKQMAADLRNFADRIEPDPSGKQLLRGLAFFGALAYQQHRTSEYIALTAECLGTDLGWAVENFQRSAAHIDKVRSLLFFGMSANRPAAHVLASVSSKLEETFAAQEACIARVAEILADQQFTPIQ